MYLPTTWLVSLLLACDTVGRGETTLLFFLAPATPPTLTTHTHSAVRAPCPITFQIPRWAAWWSTLLGNGSIFSFLLVRDTYKDDTASTNFLVVQQVKDELSRHSLILPGRKLDSWLAARSNLKVTVECDTLLLGLLKSLGVVQPQASRVKLASVAAIYTALQRHPVLRFLVEPVKQLRLEVPPLGGTSPIVTNQHLQQRPPIRTPLRPAGVGLSSVAASEDNGGGTIPEMPKAGIGTNPRGAGASTSGHGAANATAAACSRGAATPAVQQMYYTSQQPFPTALPQRTDWDNVGGNTRLRFGLLDGFRRLHSKQQNLSPRKCLPRQCPYRAELKAYEPWCLAPMNLGEGGKAGITPKTLHGYLSTISKFLGFSYKILGVQLPFLSLRLVTNQVSDGAAEK